MVGRVTPNMIAAAWRTWRARHGGKIGPGPAFVEAINAAFDEQERCKEGSDLATTAETQAESRNQRISPCPFCGVELYACTYDGGKTRYAHEVNGCILDRKFVQGEKQEAAWNRRMATGCIDGTLPVEPSQNSA